MSFEKARRGRTPYSIASTKSLMVGSVVVIGSALLGLVVALSPLSALGISFLVLIVPVAWKRPTAAIGVYTIMMASGIWYEWYPLIPLPGGYALYPHEILFALLVVRAMSVVSAEVDGNPRLRRVVVFGSIATLTVLFAAGVSLVGGRSLGDVVNGIRGYILIALVPAVAVLVNEERHRANFVRLVAGIAVGVGTLMVIQLILGPSVEVFPGARLDAGFEEASSLVRSHPPAMVLVTVLSASIVGMVLAPRRSVKLKRIHIYLLGVGAAVVLLLGFWRSYWIAGLAGGAVALALQNRQPRQRLAAFGASALLVFLFFVLPLMYPQGISTGVQVVDVAVDRFTNVFTGDVLESGSVADRLYEFRVAAGTLSRSPVFGVGPGGQYGAVVTRYRDGLAYTQERGSAHNSFLSLYLYLGLPGLIAFTCLLLVLFKEGWTHRPAREYTATWSLWAGLSGSIIAVIVASMASNWLGNISQLSAVAVALGVMASSLRDRVDEP